MAVVSLVVEADWGVLKRKNFWYSNYRTQVFKVALGLDADNFFWYSCKGNIRLYETLGIINILTHQVIWKLIFGVLFSNCD